MFAPAQGLGLGIGLRPGRTVGGGDLSEFENALVNSAGVTLVNSRGVTLLSGNTGGTAKFAANSSGRILINSQGKALLMPN
jgi:hypothetical protein